MVSSGLRIGSRASEKPLRRIYWISPIQTDTRASSAAYGIDLDALDVGRADLRERTLETERLRLELHPVLEVLERLQGKV